MLNSFLSLILLGAFAAGATCTEPSFVEIFSNDGSFKLVGNPRVFRNGSLYYEVKCESRWLEMATAQQARIAICYDEDSPISYGEGQIVFALQSCSLLNPVSVEGSFSHSPVDGVEWESRAEGLTLRISWPGKHTACLYDRQGRRVWQAEGFGPGESTRERGGLSAGVYFLRVAGAAGAYATAVTLP